MELSDLVLPAVALGATAVGLFGAWRFYRRYYRVVPTNRALVLYGGPRATSGSSSPAPVDVRVPRIVVGGGVLVPPWRNGADFLSLSPLDVDLRLIVPTSAAEADGTPWEVGLAARVKIPTEPRMLSAAAENLLGQSESEVCAMVVRTLESVAPAVILRELSADPRIDWDRLAATLQAAIAPELVSVGLEVRTLSVTQIRRLSHSDSGDRSLVPAPPLSRDLLWASGDLGVRLRGVEVRLDRTERSLGLLSAEVMRLGRDASQFPELPALQPYDSTEDERSSRTSSRGPRGPGAGGTGGTARPLLDAEE
ncbi:MAG: hypothetical protein L3K14_09220 [Thermoplasmata archaeon]|nr:hypothetical protein [Thermoplasmata archaeon]